MWDVQKGVCVRIFTGHLGGINTVAVSPDGTTMASASDDHLIKLWDLASGGLIKTFVGHEGNVTSLEFSKNGTLLASSGEDDSVRLWDTKSDQEENVEVQIVQTAKKEVEAVKSFYTKQSPVYDVGFTNRNILVALSVFQPTA
jgi:transcription initiation factor TFIID subunit 5